MNKEFKVICKNCGKEFTVIEEETKFPIKGDKYFCSISCANTRHHSKEIREKISQGVKKSEKYIQSNNIKHQKYLNRLNILKQNIYNKLDRYYCGSKELDDLNPDISCRQSPKYFKKLIPFGLNINTLYTEEFIQEHKKVKELLYNEYVINGLSPKDIYNKYNCNNYFNSSETLLHLFKDWDFPIRSFSAAVVNEYIQGKHNDYGQWHTTWNNKEVYLRSSFELDYAKELDEQQINYDVEYLHIKYWDSKNDKFRCAIPDFYLPNTNTIVEIKSTWTLDKQNMKDKMKAYKDLGYNFKLICDHKELSLEI